MTVRTSGDTCSEQRATRAFNLAGIALVLAFSAGCAGGDGTSTDSGKRLATSNGANGEGNVGAPSAPAGGGGAVSSGGGGDGAGSSGGGGTGAPGAPDAGGTMCAKSALEPSQVVMLGDSYLDPSWADTSLDLFAFAQQAGALGANETYRHYYLGGASMNGGMGQFNIPYQYEQMAMVDDPDIAVVVMDGGGNDVLISDRSCLTQAPPANAGCAKTIDGALGKAKEELAKMGANGVRDVVYFFYPHLDATKSDGILFGGASAVNETLDYAYPMARALCETSVAPRCFFVDSRAAFEGHTDEYIKPDRVHPSAAGAVVLAGLVWRAMADHCIAQ